MNNYKKYNFKKNYQIRKIICKKNIYKKNYQIKLIKNVRKFQNKNLKKNK